MAALETPICDFGWPARDFSLKGVDGRVRTLDQCRGEAATLVMFLCNHCPFVKAAIGRIVQACHELETYGVSSVAIMSNDTAAYPEDSFDNMQTFAERHKFPFPYLWDETQEVARQYGAVCTPDFFGFNRDLKLHYRGRLDDGRTDPPSPGARRELFEAMKLIAHTGQGPDDQIASIGCSIKWRD